MFGFGKPKGPLKRAQIEKMLEDSASFAGADLSGADLSNLEFSQVNLRGARLTNAHGRKVEFSQCDLQGAILEGFKLEDSEFSQCELQQASFYGAQLARIEFTQCDFKGASLAAALRIDACEFCQCEHISGLRPEQLYKQFSDMDDEVKTPLAQERMKAFAALVQGRYKEHKDDNELEVVGQFQGRSYRVGFDLDFDQIEVELRCDNALIELELHHDPEASASGSEPDEWDHDRDRSQRIFLAPGTYIESTVNDAPRVQQVLHALPGFGAHVSAWMQSLGLEELELGERTFSACFKGDLLRTDLSAQIPKILQFLGTLAPQFERGAS